ncbi:D-alanine--D-alanine ligase [Aureibacillus halotolerans]|uniref:D-alanine--D-alanine ligase n=1 Tax=Aureibacillus halotolerans TaxID=1508390 RepID=A0A4R6TZJ5_9BACI|nr:D-alanine--D-alanine ligase [Aureibacillus halotolerans]TDQ37415.1 D-alanine--D-alanine ligase [Aureibacillus halotolerans]
MSKLKVGIIFGGKSAEHEVSLQSAKNIVEAIDPSKYEVVLIGIDKKGQWQLNDASTFLLNEENPALIRLNASERGVAISPGKDSGQFIATSGSTPMDQLDVVFPIVHGTLGEDGSLQGMLRLANVPYVGPNVLSSAICMDKDIAKKLLSSAGIQTAKGVSFTSNQKEQITFASIEAALGTPVFIKPANMGSSVGVNKAQNEEEFVQAVEEAFLYDHKIIIEEAIVGREIEVAVLGNEEPEASLPGEILPQSEFYSYASKYIDEDGAGLAAPADLTPEQTKAVQESAIAAFQALQCEGLSRVDFFLQPDDTLLVNEINTLPGFTAISMYPKLWEVSGVSYPDLIERLIQLAIERHQRTQGLKSSIN